ncbi:LMAN1 [Cordylochernes scorpioides]|uniref:LMAN1 n=1 Tax=Cordylochernes scorpioides TaxID=51811 RepID=A0ABY6K5C9_9ARAC|nr:LMAN1 [Cordylochernes scorpioides]
MGDNGVVASGSIWAKNKTNFNWWEVELVFRITGRGRLGADGLVSICLAFYSLNLSGLCVVQAFWYTDRRGVEGPVFGSNDNWNGLGIFFDSFDNDGKSNNPYVMAMVNDGSKSYDHQSDGMHQQLAGCQRDFRNKPFPVRAKIEYYKNVLTIMINHGLTANDQDYELCLRAENVFLPQYGMFGVSAATGALAGEYTVTGFLTNASIFPPLSRQTKNNDKDEPCGVYGTDDHDVHKFLTTALHPPGSEPVSTDRQAGSGVLSCGVPGICPHCRTREGEVLQGIRAVQGKAGKTKGGVRDILFVPGQLRILQDPSWCMLVLHLYVQYEGQQQQELKQIFQGQSHIFEVVKGLSRKMDEIIGRQERLMSMVSAVQVPHPGGAPAGGAAYQVPSDAIRRHEVEAILGNQKELIQNIRDLRAFIPEIHQRIQTMSAGGGDADAEIKEALGNLRRDMSAVLVQSSKPCPQAPPPPPSNCLSPTFFLTFMGIQLVAVAGYLIYRWDSPAHPKHYI